MTIQLSVEEGLEYQKFDAELTGYQAGVSATLEFLRRRKVESLVKSRPGPAARKEGE